MTFPDPRPTRQNESLAQATKRKLRESELRAHPKSKSQLRAEEAAKRDEALSRSTLDPSSKGFQMMAKLGYKPGMALGRPSDSDGGGGEGQVQGRLLEPVGLEMKEGKAGIGADAERKRRFREEVERRVEGEKRRKVEEGEFRDRQRMEREERRREGQILGAMKVAERLEEEDEQGKDGFNGVEGEARDGEKREARGEGRPRKPLVQINVLWRGAVKQRELAERDRRMRYDLQQPLSRLPTYEDPDEEKEDKMALGKKETEEVELDLDQEDPELDEFEALETSEKLQKLVQYLRERWNYCFWCKYRYENSEMEGCPGTTEDDHD